MPQGLLQSKVQKPTVLLGLQRSKARKPTVPPGLLQSKVQKQNVPPGLLQSKVRKRTALPGLLQSKARKQTVPLGLLQSKVQKGTKAFAEQRAKVLRPAVGAPGAAGLPGGHRAGRGGKRPGSIGGVCRVLVSFFLQLGAPRKRPSARNKEAPFRVRVFCRIRADFARKVCAFHRVAFFAPQSDECVAAEKRAAAAGGRSRRAREEHP